MSREADLSEGAEPTVRFVPLSELASALHSLGAYGAYARYLLRSSPDAEVPVASDDSGVSFAVSGMAIGHPEVQFAWLFGAPGPGQRAVLGFLRDKLRPLFVYARQGQRPSVEAVFPDHKLAVDHLLQHTGEVAPVDADVVWFNHENVASLTFADCVSERFPPLEFWESVGFCYAGLREGGRVVAALDYTVDDGRYAAIQAVFTDPELRGRGLGRALLSAVIHGLHAQSKIPLYVVSQDNAASIALAEGVGFERVERLLVLE